MALETSTGELLRVSGLTASVDEKEILHGIDLSVAQGETHVLMGPNGAGKSTLGHVVMGDPTYNVTAGSIVFNGQDVTTLSPDKRSHAGMFLSFQAPVEIPGVPLSSFLRAAAAGREGLNHRCRFCRRFAPRALRARWEPTRIARSTSRAISNALTITCVLPAIRSSPFLRVAVVRAWSICDVDEPPFGAASL